MWQHSGKVAIVGIGHSPINRHWDEKPENSLGGLTIDAVEQAAADAGIPLKDIDGLFGSPWALGDAWSPRPVPAPMAERYQMTPNDPEDGISKVTSGWLARNMGLKNLKVQQDIQAFLGANINNAIEAVAAGRCKCAVVIRSLNNFQGRYGQSGPNAGNEARGANQFTMPYGQAGPAGFAVYLTRYLWKYNLKPDDLADFAVNNRRNALMQDHGYWAENEPIPLTKEDYMLARWICWPIRLFDCDLPVMAAGAFIITTADRAKDLKHPPVYVLGHGGNAVQARGLEEIEAGNATVARRTWESAGLGPKDMDFANLYDGYAVFTPLWIEAFGLAGKGDGIAFLKPERIAIEGSFPFNTSSSNAAGRTHGVSHLYDAVVQIRGEAGPRQVKKHELGLVETGPPPNGHAQVLSRSPR